MLSVTLGEKTYTVEYVTALALREIGRPMEIIRRADAAGPAAPHPSAQALTPSPEGEGFNAATFERDLDTLVNWFCVLFQNQFKPAEVYEKYPADRLITDITLAALAVNNRVSGILSSFPTKAAAARTKEAGK